MARTAIGITTTAITWEKTKSEISVNETGLAEISVEGAVNSTGIGLEAALELVPKLLPASSSGPIGVSTKYSGAKLSTKSAAYEDGTWQVRATYTKGGTQTANYPDGTTRSEDDRTERRITVQEEPLLSHPVALKFPTKEKNLLANLMRGETIIANPNYNPDEADETKPANWEFGMIDPITGDISSKATFSDEEQTSGEISGSPKKYARLIKAGITTYQRKSIRHSWNTARDEPATNAQYKKVGAVVNQPPGAPELASSYQWMLTGIIDTSSNGETWQTSYEYEASGPGGFLGMLYEGGANVLDT